MSAPPDPPARPRPPWHSRLSILRLVVGVLALAVVGEGLLLLRVERQLQTLVQRLDDLRSLRDLGLGERPGRLLLISSDQQGITVADLRTLQAQVDAWREGFVARHQLEPELAEMLAGVLSSHISNYGDARIQANMGAIRLEEQEPLFRSLQVRCDRSVVLLLGDELGRTFAKEFDAAWQTWTAAHSQ